MFYAPSDQNCKSTFMATPRASGAYHCDSWQEIHILYRLSMKNAHLLLKVIPMDTKIGDSHNDFYHSITQVAYR